MIYPTLSNEAASRDMVSAFLGYNHNPVIADGEWFDMANLTSDSYPVLAPRRPRTKYDSLPNIRGALWYDGSLWTVQDKAICKDGVEIQHTLMTRSTGTVQMVSMGAYIIIYDGGEGTDTDQQNASERCVWINTIPKDGKYEYGSVNNSVVKEGIKAANDYYHPEYDPGGREYQRRGIYDAYIFEPCDADGNVYSSDYIQAEPPSAETVKADHPNVGNGDSVYWVNTSATPHTRYQWSSATDNWVPMTSVYIRISLAQNTRSNGTYGWHTSGGIMPAAYDTVYLNGFGGKIGYEVYNTDGTFMYYATDGNRWPDPQVAGLDGARIIYASGTDEDTSGYTSGTDWIVVQGELDQRYVCCYVYSTRWYRRMPNLDYICEHENRLWGCRRGINLDGEYVNEIYCCKQGDFRNWQSYIGVATDSFAVSVGSEGSFTGICAYGGYILAFKESCVHKIYGNYPANYTLSTAPIQGVESGSSRSLCVVNNILHYKSRRAVCSFDGTQATEISTALGGVTYSNGIGGVYGSKYYLNLTDTDGNQHLFVYDTQKGFWHREDILPAYRMVSTDEEILSISKDGEVTGLRGIKMRSEASYFADPESEGKVAWAVESGMIGTGYADYKYCSRLMIRMALALGTEAKFYIQYDSLGDWEYLFTMKSNNTRSFSVPVRPKRCDHFRIRIEGVGSFMVYNLTKTMTQGSDIG